MDGERAAYDELYVYTMGRPGFILQHVVDASAVQNAVGNETAHAAPIGLVFGLVGLYLHIEKQYSGRQVQKAHAILAARKRPWPAITLPDDLGPMTAGDVLSAPAGPDRDAAIDAWCRSLWTAFAANRETIVALLAEYRIV